MLHETFANNLVTVTVTIQRRCGFWFHDTFMYLHLLTDIFPLLAPKRSCLIL